MKTLLKLIVLTLVVMAVSTSYAQEKIIVGPFKTDLEVKGDRLFITLDKKASKMILSTKGILLDEFGAAKEYDITDYLTMAKRYEVTCEFFDKGKSYSQDYSIRKYHAIIRARPGVETPAVTKPPEPEKKPEPEPQKAPEPQADKTLPPPAQEGATGAPAVPEVPVAEDAMDETKKAVPEDSIPFGGVPPAMGEDMMAQEVFTEAEELKE